MNYSSMINRLTGIKREQMQSAVASTTGVKTVINDKAVCMYQIQIKRFTDEHWTDYLRPWLVKQTASDIITALETLDVERDDTGKWVYQIVEV